MRTYIFCILLSPLLSGETWARTCTNYTVPVNKEAGTIIVTETSENTHRGTAAINGGFTGCKKPPNGETIQRDIKVLSLTPVLESGRWFGANGILTGNSVFTDETAKADARLDLNNTIQAWHFIHPSHRNAFFENNHPEGEPEIPAVVAVAGLSCDNCSFMSGSTTMNGTTASPAVILGSPRTFAGDITLNGPCNFTIGGTGDYRLSGVIRGTGPLTCSASDAGLRGLSAGITLEGTNANTYTGQTTIAGGYIICNKPDGVAAIPSTVIKISSASLSVFAHLWCQRDNQLGTGAIVDFRDARSYSYIHLNGTTQTAAGLQANNSNAIVENNWENTYFPAGMTAAQISTNPAALNIVAGSTACTFGGGGFIRKGLSSSPDLTVTITGGTQIIQNPAAGINNVTLTSVQGATLEFNSSSANSYSLGGGVTFRGAGIIKKTGAGTVTMNNSTVLKSGGKIWVAEGIFRNENYYNKYINSNGTETNIATLQLEAPGVIFDIWSNISIFDGLTGGGIVQNSWGATPDVNTPPGGGYCWLTIGQNNSQGNPVFEGIIRDNSTNVPVSANGFGTGGIALKKVGSGVQVLKGDNRYTGPTTVTSGTLQLQGNGQLGSAGAAGIYNGAIDISNSAGTGTIFEHKGDKVQVFTGNITNTGSGTLGTYLQSGTGKTIINGAAKDFTGDINITAGFLGGSSNLSKAGSLRVGASGSIGGGYGVDDSGAALTVAGVNFAAAASKLVVTSTSVSDGTPSLLDVKTSGGSNPGPISAANGFTVDIVGGTNQGSGYIIKCSNGLSSNFPLPALGLNNTGKTPLFRWDDTGLFMAIGKLTCDNCTFVSGGRTITGTTASPAFILGLPGTFAGGITLNGPCNFVITGTGDYLLSGVISGTGPLTCYAPDAGWTGNGAGVTFGGTNANTYTGQTTITGGYIVCNKPDGVAAVPGNSKVLAMAANLPAEIWCQANNQLGNGAAVLDFSGAQSYSYIYLNGTTQTVAGLQADNGNAVVENNWDNTIFPAGLTAAQVSTSPATLNIAAGSTTYTFGGGGFIRRGSGTAPALTVNVTRGTQIIQNPTGNINNATLASARGATLEFNSSTGNTYLLGPGVTLRGEGIIKKTGEGAIGTNSSTVLKTEQGQILVADGVFRNDMTANVYSGNTAILQVDAPNGSNHNPTFDTWGNNSVFGGLRGGGWVQNNWGVFGSPRGGYNDLTLGENSTQNYSVFEGIIRDNPTNGPVSANNFGTGGIALRKVGTGMQVLKGDNRYTGSTTVSSGTLQLQGNGQLGNATAAGIYNGTLEISNSAGTQAIFEHNGGKTQVFTGNISNTGSGNTGLFIQSGTGKSIINGAVKDFTGDINIIAGFLGGSGNLSKAGNLYVGTAGSIGGGYGVDDNGATLTIASLNFLAAASKLIVTSTSATDATPSLLDVKNGSGVQRPISAAFGFKVDLVSDNLSGGYLIKCSNGLSSRFPLPTLGVNNTGKTPVFRWDNTGLYMGIDRLTCDNCTFTSGSTTITGTSATPAVILGLPGTFAGDITLNGPCNFTITGTGDYRLSGVIKGTGPLTCNAPGAGAQGHSAGITLEGTNANTYTGQTTITGGYVICNKPNGVAAIPSASGTVIKISATSAGLLAQLWCQKDNQLGSGAIIDFSNAQAYSYINLNGTTQTVAGLQSNNDNAVVENNWDNTFFPAGMTAAQLSTGSATLNIAAGSTACTFGGGGYIRKGAATSPALTVNITGGTQIIQNPTAKINNVTLTSELTATLEFNSSTGSTYSLGEGVSFKGGGTVKKTGEGTVATNSSTIIRPGLIRVSDGVFQNGGNNVYSTTIPPEDNTGVLQVDAPNGSNHNPTFDLWGNNPIFTGLIGGGWVQNNSANVAPGALPGGGYSNLTLGNQSNTHGYAAFDGVIRDNSANGPVSPNGAGGIALTRRGAGIQVLTGDNRYTGSTTVSFGTLKLQGNGQLGNASEAGIYNGALEISNSTSPQAIFEHNGDKTQVFTGNITNTGSGTLGTYLQSGTGKTIINGAAAKDFTGDINITAGFLGGSGNLSNANRVTVEASGSIGGGYGVDDNGATLTVSGLNFLAAASKLIVTSASATDATPALLDVKTGSNPGPVSAANGFTVDLIADNLVSGYIIKCSNGFSNSLPLPALGVNNTGKTPLFKWDNMGLYMVIGEGLTCDNCTFTLGSTTTTGTPASPASILNSPGTFIGDITLNGPCNFTITGTGNYTIFGTISGTGPLTCNAPNADWSGHNAGITLGGADANTYTGQITITGGYIICNKPNGVAAIPSAPGTAIKISAASTGIYAHLWCQGDNQLGTGAIIDFTDAHDNSYIHLNGTTQTAAGLQANNGKAVVENNWDNIFLPSGMAVAQLSTNPAALNIAAGSTTYTFGGGGFIRKGTATSPALTVTVTGGTQIIQNPTANINNVTLASTQGATLEFNSSTGNTYSLGGGVTFSGAGTVRKTGEGPVTTNNSTILKSGQILVVDGVFRNDNGNNVYSAAGLTNTANLQVDAPDPTGNNHNPTFDLSGNVSIFDGLTGGGWVQNNWGTVIPLPGDGYAWLTLGQNNSQNDPVFDGVIRDNLNNDPVDAFGNLGKGGTALKKVGNGTQGLSGNNTYTGVTSVMAGTLKLQGNGTLGGGSYTNILDISNVAAGAPAIFEHNGTRTQIFNDNISSSNSGTLGTFLQSGDGKTIMNGVKNFTGNVTITRGFLGGSGDLSQTNSVTVGSGGSIGGGNGVDDNGATLTVSGLNFLAAASKLIVTSISATDGTPALLDVKTRGSSSSGPITAANGFTVDAAGGTNLVSGYILKCSNGVSGNLPLPTLGDNNTGKTVCFRWDNTGLWMQILFGNITLTVNTVCPKGVNSGNPSITITAKFSDPRDAPPPGALFDFLISDPSVMDGPKATTMVDNVTMTTTFRGANQTAINKPYRVTCRGYQNCIAELAATINPQPTLSISSGTNPTCKGTPMVLQAAGNGPLTISSANTNIATVVNNTPSVGSAAATTLAAGNVNFLAADKDGCNSEPLPVLVKDLPVMDEIPDLSVCGNASVPVYTPPSSGVGETKPTHYQWKVETNAANSADVGLPDYTTDWSKAAISGFTAANTTTPLKRDVTVSAYNSTSGCTSVSQVYTITVNPNPVITANTIDVSKLCSGTPYIDALVGEEGSWAVYKAGTTDAGLSTVTNSTTTGHADIQAGTVTITTPEDVVFTSTTTSCQGHLTITIHPKPVMDEIPDLSVCGAASVPVYTPPSSGAGETKPTHYQWKVEANAANSADVGLPDYTTDWSKAAISGFTAANTTTALKRDVTVSAYNSTSGCTSVSQVYTITVNPNPVITANTIDVSKLCSGTPYIDALVGGEGSWAVYKAGTTDAGLSTVTNSTTTGHANIQAGTVTITTPEDVVFTSTTTSCQGHLTITIHPKPVMDEIPDLSVCGAASVPVYTPPSSGVGETKPTHYQWKVETNAANSADVGLPDYTTDWSKAAISGFTAANTTAALKRDVTVSAYNSTSGCTSVSQVYTITVNPNPVITANTIDVSKLCSGTPYIDALVGGEGNWAVYKSGTTDAGLSTVTNSAATGHADIQAGVVTITTPEDVVFTSTTTSCQGHLTITIHPKPVMDEIPDLSVCGNASVAAYTPPSSGVGETKPTHYQWKVETNAANSADVGLPDYTTDWSKAAISGFTAANTTTALKRDVTVSAYNSTSGCTSVSQVYTITVNPNPVITANTIDVSKLCSGTPYIDALVGGEGSWAVYKAGTTDAGLSTVTNSTTTGHANIQAGTVTITTPEDVVFTSTTTSCQGHLTITIHPKPVMDEIPDLSACSAASVPVYTPPSSGVGETKPTHYQWKVETNAANSADVGLPDYTTDWSKAAISGFTAANTTTALKRDVTVSAYNSTSGCTSVSQVYTITVNPNPVITANTIDVSKLCSGTPYIDALVGGEGSWAVYKAGTTDAGLSTVTNSTTTGHANIQAGTVTITTPEDVVFTSTTTSCQGHLTITIHPKPVMDEIPDLSVCGAASVPVYTPPSSGVGETKPTHYQWKVETNAANSADVGLPDYTTDWSKAAISGFTAANTTAALKRDVTVSAYNSTSGCTSVSQVYTITVNPNPVITANTIDVSKLCSGTPYIDALVGGEGNWAVYKSGTTDAGLSTVTNSAATGHADIQAGVVTITTPEDVVFTSTTTSCQGHLTITIHPKPVMDEIPDLSVCGNASVAAYTPPSSGVGETKPTHYQWKVETNAANSADVGLPDYTTDWSKAAISGFTAANTTTALKRDVTVSAYNSTSGCTSVSQVYTITVNPNPVITANTIDVSKLCSGTPYIDALVGGEGSWAVYKAGTTDAGLSTVTNSTTTGHANIQAGTVTITTPEDVVFTSTTTSCQGHLTITIHPKPVMDEIPDLSVCGAASVPVYTPPSSGVGETKPTHYQWKVETNAANSADVGLPDYTTDWSKAAISGFTAANTTAALKRDVTVSAYNSTSGCTSVSQVYTITVNPNPVITANTIDVSKLCSGTPYIDALVGGEGNWAVYKSGTTDAGLSTVTNSAATGHADIQAGVVTITTPEDVVFTSTTTSCQGHLTITIHPKPVMDEIPDLSVCGNASVAAYTPPSSGVGETKPTHYQWKVETNAANSADVGLPDYTTDWSKAAISGFTAANTTTALKRDVTVSAYNSTSGCTSVSQVYTITVNPNPVITANTIDASKLCSGTPYIDALVGGEGNWAVYKAGTTDAGLSTVTNSAATGHADIQAGVVTITTPEDVVFTSTTTSCQGHLTITIHPKPVMDEIPDLSVCGNASVAAYTPPSSGAGETRPTHYQWKVEANAANSADVGLPDYTTDWSKAAISGFTAANTTTALKRDVTVSAYNSTSGCTSVSQVYTITVNSGLVLTHTVASPICNGTETNIALHSTLLQTTYTWIVNNNRVGAQSQTTASSPTDDRFLIQQRLTNGGNSSETVTYEVTGTSGTCSGTVSIPIEVSNTAPVKPTVTGGGHYCVNPDNGTCQTRLIPSAPGTNNVEWTYTSYYGSDQPANGITGNTQQAVRRTLTELNDNLVLSNTPSAVVYYVFRPYTGCLGNPSDPIGIRLYAAPVIAAIPPGEVCSSSEAYPTAVSIALSSSTPDAVYTWTVDRANGPDVSGYSEPIREGARVPTQNPSQARSSPIADVLSLPANADTQTLDYWITPWHLGCPGKAVLGRVKVNPLPVITAPSDREHCVGNAKTVAAEPLNGTHEVNAFTWTGGTNAGLADQKVYGPGLPAYRVASTTTPLALKVTISGKNDKGCKASTAFNITLNPKPSITLGNSQVLCTGTTIETAAQTDIEVSYPIAGTKYKWTASFVDFRPDGKSDMKIVNGNNALLPLPVRDSPKEDGNFTRKIIAATDSYGQITFRLTPFLGSCAGDGKDTDVIVKGVNLLPDVANTSPDVCSGGTTHIKIGKEGDGNIYRWEGINKSGNVLGFTPSKESAGVAAISDALTLTADNNKKRDNVLYRITPRRRFTNVDGDEYYCMGRVVSSTVFVNPIPVLSLSPTTASICSGEKTAITYSINLEPPESNEVYYSWEVTPNRVGARSSTGFQTTIPQQLLTNDNASESSVVYTITPQYQHRSGGGCKGQPVTSAYQISSRAEASISNMQEAVCLGDKVTLEANIKGANSQWLKNGKAIPGATGDSYEVLTDKESESSYAVTITNTCGISTSKPKTVKISADAYFTGGSAAIDKSAAPMGEAVKFSYTYSGTNNAPKVDYLWDFNDNTTADTESATHSYTKSGTYYPTLKVKKPGQAVCTKTFSFSLEIGGVDPNSSNGVFPIPARDRITITNEDDMQNITLSDMSGKLILNEDVKGRSVTLSVAYIAQGIYLLTIIDTKGGVKRLKIAKE